MTGLPLCQAQHKYCIAVARVGIGSVWIRFERARL